MRHRTNLFMTAVGCRIPKEDRSSSIAGPSELRGAGGQLPSQSVGVLPAKLYCLFICPHRFSEFPMALNCSSSLFFLLFLFCLPPLLPLQSTWELSHEELSTKNRTKLRAEKQWRRTSQCRRRRRAGGSTSGSPSNHCALHSMPKRLHYGRNSKIVFKY